MATADAFLLALLRLWFTLNGRAWPFSECATAGDRLICSFPPSQPPEVPQYVTIDNVEFWPTATAPEVWHGTTIDAALAISAEGRMIPAGQIPGLEPHSPDGVPFYADQQISAESIYIQGAQIRAQLHGIPVSLTASETIFKKPNPLPDHVLVRLSRSASKKFGSKGREWVAPSSAIQLVSVAFHQQQLHSFLQTWYRQQGQTMSRLSEVILQIYSQQWLCMYIASCKLGVGNCHTKLRVLSLVAL